MNDQLWTAVVSNPIIFGLVLLAIAYMAVSKKLAQVSGPIGAVARWWNGRQVARVKRDRALWVEEHAKDRERDLAELEVLREDVRWLVRDQIDMRRREQLRDAQARKHTAWDNDVVRRLQAAGLAVSDPPPLYLDLAPLHIPDETPPPGGAT